MRNKVPTIYKTAPAIALIGLLAPIRVFAEKCGDVSVSIAVGCKGSGNPIYDYLKAIIFFMGGAIGLAVVITIIVAGIQYSSSAGNPASITKAKERLTNAVIGLVLYLFLAAILRYLVPQIFV